MANSDEFKVLANVIRVAREELADREQDEVPARLRKAATGTGKRLPAPHQKAIIDHITSDEPFRRAVKARWDQSGIDGDVVGVHFLEDPAAAGMDISLSVASIALERVSAERDDALNAATDLSAQLAESKDRLQRSKRDSKTALGQQAASDKRSRQGLERSAELAGAKLSDVERQNSELVGELAASHKTNETLSTSLDRATERAAKRELSTQQRSVPPQPPLSGAVPGDAAALAALLDAMEIQMRPYREAHRQADPPVREVVVIQIPNGIRPDSAAGIDAVIGQVPDRILIDGYNVAGAVLLAKFSTREGREAAVARAAMLKRATQAFVTVVFDASNVKGEDRTVSPHGVEIVFEPEGSADDAIVNLVAAGNDRCVVITDDRELQSRVTRPNCVVLYTKALVAWSEHLNES